MTHQNSLNLWRYSVECSERGLKLTSPGCRSKDEGFESDCESIRSVRVTEAVELDISDLIGHLEIGATLSPEKGADPGSALHSSPSSPGGSMDSTSLNSSSGLHGSDDNNSSSGNGSDSDEFGASGDNGRSPFWETLPNLSSFQSYPIEDVVFCHCDSFHPSTLVWVARHLEKMIALVTAFRTRSEAEELFHTYRELRVKLKPVKYKINPILGLKIPKLTSPSSPSPGPSPTSSDESCSEPNNSTPPPFDSLPTVFPTAILQETSSNSSLFSYEPKSLGFDLNLFRGTPITGTTSLLLREPLSRTGSNSLSLHNHVYVSNPNIVRFGPTLLDSSETRDNNSSSGVNPGEEEDDDSSSVVHPSRPQRKVFNGTPVISTSSSASSGSVKAAQPLPQPNKQPVLLVPLKTESVSAPKSTYPKESYLYHVMGRSSSTFAPYQRSLNFLPHQQYPPGGGGGGDFMAWGNGGQLLVPFSSWMELSDLPKGSGAGRKSAAYPNGKGRGSGRLSNGRISANLGAKGTTSKILLRDAGRDGMWASLSQRFKKNVRENLIPKLNGMWSQGGEGGRKKRTNKKVTFNAWATVQMVWVATCLKITYPG